MRNKAIGVFDSGIGGLTIAKEIMELMPNEKIVYFGDTARVPYGSKSPEMITQLSIEALKFLLSQDVKLVVVACNTICATCIDELCTQSNVPVVGIIGAGAKAAVSATKNRIVGVTGTERTVDSGAYEKAIHSIDDSIKIYQKACPLFVPLVEEGWLENEAAFYTAKTYLEPIKEKGIDTLVLGCTHFPLLRPVISKVMGNDVKLVDPAKETAKYVKSLLAYEKLERKDINPPLHKFFVSKNPEKFAKIGQAFLGRSITPVQKVEI